MGSLNGRYKWSNYRIPGHSKLYPFNTGYAAMPFVYSLSFCMFLEQEIDISYMYIATWLLSYVAM